VDRVAKHGARSSRVVLADDNPLYRSALMQLLIDHSDCEVVGVAADGREAWILCQRLRPDLVLMDVQMPEMDGLAATRVIKQQLPDIAVLIVTVHEDPDYLLEAIKAGAAGFILKSATPQEIIEALYRVLSGESPLSRELSEQLLRRLVAEKQQQRSLEEVTTFTRSPAERREASLTEPLAPREAEVLRLVACGHTNQQIAQNLFISTSTVKKYVDAVIGKLGVSDRVQAAVRAAELGLLSEESSSENMGPYV
jgi:DNA-binding NarL/FixJ family response regulator